MTLSYIKVFLTVFNCYLQKRCRFTRLWQVSLWDLNKLELLIDVNACNGQYLSCGRALHRTSYHFLDRKQYDVAECCIKSTECRYSVTHHVLRESVIEELGPLIRSRHDHAVYVLAKQYPQLMLFKISVVGYQPHIASEKTVVAGDVTQVQHDIVHIQRCCELIAGICKASVTVAGYLSVSCLQCTCISYERRQRNREVVLCRVLAYSATFSHLQKLIVQLGYLFSRCINSRSEYSVRIVGEKLCGSNSEFKVWQLKPSFV